MKRTQISILIITSFSFLFGCSNEPASFSQGEAATKISLTVEGASVDANGKTYNQAEAPTPVSDAQPEQLDELFDAFDAFPTDGEMDFDPDQFFNDLGDEGPGDDDTATASTESDDDDTDSSDADTDTDADSTDTTADDSADDSMDTDTDTDADSSSTDSNSNSNSNSNNSSSNSSDDSTTTDDSTSTPPTTTDDKKPTLPPGVEEPSNGEKKLCGKLTGVDASDIVVDQGNTLKSGTVLAIKLTGKDAEVELDLSGASDAVLQGVCIFSAGSGARVKAMFGLKIKNFLYIGRGNDSAGSVELTNGGSMDAAAISVTSKSATFELIGNGGVDCSSVYVHGKKNNFTCK